MKKKNVFLIIGCIAVALVIAVAFLVNAEKNKNPLLGIWKNDRGVNVDLRVFKFDENGYLTEITLDRNGQISREMYTYTFSKKSRTLIINKDISSVDSYTYDVAEDYMMILYDDYGNESYWVSVKNTDFLQEEQNARKEILMQQWEEDQRLQEEKNQQEEAKEQEFEKLRDEYSEFREKPFRDAEIKLVGRWENDSDYYHEFFEDGTVISEYPGISSSTVKNGTYSVYPGEINLSESELLQFKEDAAYEPDEFEIVFTYDDGTNFSFELHIYQDYINLNNNPWGNGVKFNKVN